MIIFNSRVSTALWLSIKTVMLTLEELFPFDLPLKMHQWIKIIITQLLLGTWTHILSTLNVVLPVTVDPFDNFLDTHGYPFYRLQVPFMSTTVSINPLDKFVDSHGYPFSPVHVPSRSAISCCELYHRPCSICHTRVNSFLFQMVYYYCTTILEQFPSDLFHILLTALILRILLFHKISLKFDHGLPYGYLLLFHIKL